MTRNKYPIELLWSDEDEGCIAVVPDLPGCNAWGRTEEDAIREIRDAIAAWISACEQAGELVPKPSLRQKPMEIAREHRPSKKRASCSGEYKKFDGWGDTIIATFIPPVRYFSRVLFERILPAFDDFERESESGFMSSEHWSDIDYCNMMNMRQSMVNLHAVGLCHLYEQQFSYLVMRLVCNYERKANYSEDKNYVLESKEIDIKRFGSWKIIEELRAVCNAVKHAEGNSAERLETLRPELFVCPSALELPDNIPTRPRLKARHPLAGEDIYLKEEDVRSYALAIEDFWKEFMDVLQRQQSECLDRECVDEHRHHSA